MSPSHFLRIHFNIIFPSNLGCCKLSLSLRFFHLNLDALLISPICATCSARLILRGLITRIIFGEVYRSLSFSLLFYSLPCYLVPLRHKYSPQHRILKHPQPTFLPQFERPCFTPIKNIQNYGSVLRILYFHLFS